MALPLSYSVRSLLRPPTAHGPHGCRDRPGGGGDDALPGPDLEPAAHARHHRRRTQPDRDAQRLFQRRLEPAHAARPAGRSASSTASRAIREASPLISPELSCSPSSHRWTAAARTCSCAASSRIALEVHDEVRGRPRAACSSRRRARRSSGRRRRPLRAAPSSASEPRVRTRPLEGGRRLRVRRLVLRERGLGGRTRARERRQAHAALLELPHPRGARCRRRSPRAPHRRRPALRARGRVRDRILRGAGGIREQRSTCW